MSSHDVLRPTPDLARRMVGVWWLLSREDFAADGSRRVDASLGADPLGILTYTSERFAAQFMKRDRASGALGATSQARNNTGAVGGYDAYFGVYRVDPASGEVMHRLEGALTPANVGMEFSRTLRVEGDRLVIRLDTTTLEGEAITRVLTWRRIG